MIELHRTRQPRLAPEGVSFDPVPDHPGLVCETKGCATRLNRVQRNRVLRTIEEYREQHPLCRGCAARARQGAA